MPEGKDGSARTPRSFIRRLCLWLLAAGGLLALLEIGLRVRYPLRGADAVPSSAPDYSCELVTPLNHQRITPVDRWIKLICHPYMTYKNLPNQTTSLYSINSLGLRGPEFNPVKEPDVFRIIVTGNSATFGVGASGDQNTLPHRLQEELNRSGLFPQRVEVLNAGVMGYLTSQESVYLQLELVNFNPDMVIAYNGYADFFWPAFRTQGCLRPLDDVGQVGYPWAFYDLERKLIEHYSRQRRSFSTRTLAILQNLFRRTFLGRFLQEKSGVGSTRPEPLLGPALLVPPDPPLGGGPYLLNAECAEVIVRGYERNLKIMSDLATAWGIRLVLAVQPELGWKRHPSPEEGQNRKRVVADYPWYEKAVADIYPQLVTAARRVAAEAELEYLDLSQAFDAYPDTVFVDCVHLNDRGYQLLAQFMAGRLANRAGNAQGKE